MSTAHVVTDDTFETDVLKSSTPVVVDFWAAWCGPCRMIAPALDELAVEYAGKVSFAKLNVDENDMTSLKYNVMSLPTLLIFKDGNPIGQIIGALPKREIKRRVDAALA